MDAKLEQLCEDGLKAVGYELVDLELVSEREGWVLRIYIDHPFTPTSQDEGNIASTINHEDCECASRHLGTLLDVEDPIETTYRLEVSSPGLRRPLRKERDFIRFSGREAKVQLHQPVQGRRNFSGRLLSASDGVVKMDVNGTTWELPLEDVRRAHLEVEF